MSGNVMVCFALMIAVLGLVTTAVCADDDYYMIMFALEGPDNSAQEAHTFATFVKVDYAKGTDPTAGRIDSHTISWLPTSNDVVLLRLRPEPGTNYDLKTTLKIANSKQAEVFAWGPYSIRKELYDRALSQWQRLNRGELGFKALDRAFRPDEATNCFHAISDIVPGPLLNTGTAYGRPASAMVLTHLAPWIIHPRTTYAWLSKRLSLRDYPITFEESFKP